MRIQEKWKILHKKTVLSRAVFAINDLDCIHPSKNVDHIFSIIDAPDWINIVAVTNEGMLIFVQQHRLGTDTVTIETPAGMIEKDEDPLKAAERELAEETGYEAEDIILLKTLDANPAIMTNKIHFFLARGCTKKTEQKLDREEDITVFLYSIDDVCSMIHSGEIGHSIIVTALSLYLLSQYGPAVAPWF